MRLYLTEKKENVSNDLIVTDCNNKVIGYVVDATFGITKKPTASLPWYTDIVLSDTKVNEETVMLFEITIKELLGYLRPESLREGRVKDCLKTLNLI